MKHPIFFDDIYVRHPYKYKGIYTLDLSNFKNQILFKQKKNKKYFIHQTKFIVVNIKHCLQMKYINFPEKYKNIYKNYIEKTNQKEHSIDIFNNLIENFDINLLEQNKISLHPYRHKNKIIYIVTDGAHRCSLSLFNSQSFLNKSFYELDHRKI